MPRVDAPRSVLAVSATEGATLSYFTRPVVFEVYSGAEGGRRDFLGRVSVDFRDKWVAHRVSPDRSLMPLTTFHPSKDAAIVRDAGVE